MTSLTELTKKCKRYQAALEWAINHDDTASMQIYFDSYSNSQEEINCKVNATLHVLNDLEHKEEYWKSRAKMYNELAKKSATTKEKLLNRLTTVVSELDFKVDPFEFPGFTIVENKPELLIDDEFDAMRIPVQFRRAIKPSAIIAKELVRQYLERGQSLVFAKLSDVVTYHERGWRIKND
jgi:hypothetical protein